jgi:cytochrome oxidase assembly protein ShyY1
MVLINRGWVPAVIKEAESRPEGQVRGMVTIVGYLVAGDKGYFLDSEGKPRLGTYSQHTCLRGNDERGITNASFVSFTMQYNVTYQKRIHG